ncbi:MAG TPA: Na-translocating system protein MpsC family protein [Gaiellales bacterium]|jgi:uncharacterized protein YbcI
MDEPGLSEPSESVDRAGNGREERIGQLAQVTRAMVALYKEQFGRGPTHARSHFAGPDTIICLLEETLTPVERTLVRIGEQQRLRDIRALFQYTAERAFRTAVEEVTGRRVIAFTSGFDASADVATEVFMLAPTSGSDSAGGPA